MEEMPRLGVRYPSAAGGSCMGPVVPAGADWRRAAFHVGGDQRSGDGALDTGRRSEPRPDIRDGGPRRPGPVTTLLRPCTDMLDTSRATSRTEPPTSGSVSPSETSVSNDSADGRRLREFACQHAHEAAADAR